jgi:O-antigen ligase
MDLKPPMRRSAAALAVAQQPATWTARCAAALAIGIGFWFVGHSLGISRTLDLTGALSADRVENHFAVQQSETTTSSAVGYFIIGGMGLYCLATAARDVNWRHPLLWLCAFYIGWCGVSILWSIEPIQSFRKLAILGLMFAGAYGAASRFDLDDILWIILLVLAGLVGIGVFAEMALGTFRPWRSEYRFAGTCHPNDQGLQCALLAIVGGFIAFKHGDRPWVRHGVMALGLAGLALSKSRTTLLALIVAAAIGLVLRSRGVQRWLILSVGVASLSVVGIFSSFLSVAGIDRTADIASMGRRENISSLTGRLPLWQELWKAADDRLVAGHGYGAFWGERNVLKYSRMLSWHIPHAHNAYLDLVLSVGLVGAALYLAWVLATAGLATARYGRSGQSAELFVACVATFSLVHGVAESKLLGAGLAGFTLLAATAALTLRSSMPLATGNQRAISSPRRRSPSLALRPVMGRCPLQPRRQPR